MHWLYNIADVQIQLSSNEGWGLALTEALMCGTPFIATVTGGMQDQMGFIDKNSNYFIAKNINLFIGVLNVFL